MYFCGLNEGLGRYIKVGHLLTIIITSHPPFFLSCLFFIKYYSTVPILFGILSFVEHPSPRCFLAVSTAIFKALFNSRDPLVPCCLFCIKNVPKVVFEVGSLLGKRTVSYHTWIWGNSYACLVLVHQRPIS